MEDRGRNGGTKCILRIKEQETRLTLHEHDDDDDDDDENFLNKVNVNYDVMKGTDYFASLWTSVVIPEYIMIQLTVKN